MLHENPIDWERQTKYFWTKRIIPFLNFDKIYAKISSFE